MGSMATHATEAMIGMATVMLLLPKAMVGPKGKLREERPGQMREARGENARARDQAKCERRKCESERPGEMREAKKRERETRRNARGENARARDQAKCERRKSESERPGEIARGEKARARDQREAAKMREAKMRERETKGKRRNHVGA